MSAAMSTGALAIVMAACHAMPPPVAATLPMAPPELHTMRLGCPRIDLVAEARADIAVRLAAFEPAASGLAAVEDDEAVARRVAREAVEKSVVLVPALLVFRRDSKATNDGR